MRSFSRAKLIFSSWKSRDPFRDLLCLLPLTVLFNSEIWASNSLASKLNDGVAALLVDDAEDRDTDDLEEKERLELGGDSGGRGIRVGSARAGFLSVCNGEGKPDEVRYDADEMRTLA